MGASKWWFRTVSLAFALALVASACGDDDDDDGAAEPTGSATTAAPTATSAGGTATPTSGEAATTASTAAQPVQGGELQVLMYNEIGTLDPIRATGSGGSDAQQIFALYGALLTMDPKTVEIQPLFADSFEPSADFTVWTLKLKDGIVFTDDSPLDAAAVQNYWTRIQDPANRSPAVSAAGTIASMRVVDPLTLEVTLKTPNAHFNRAVERQAFNYVPSAKAVAAGHDFTNEPVGAGPFVLDSWVRDDRMTLSPNPKWKSSDGPYVDKLVIRTVYDETQRSDTFVKGDADLNYVGAITPSIEAGKKAGADWVFVTTPGSPSYTFNTAKPPFDDVRVRKAFIQAIDRDDMVKVVFGAEQSIDNWTFDDSPYYTADATIPPFDKAAAQALFNEVAAEKGGPIKIEIGGFQQSLDQKRAEYIQTQLNTYDNVEVTVNIADSPTAIQRVLQKNYQVHSWGYPHIDPEPNLFNYAHSGLFTNYSQYSNAQVDAALEEARQTRDQAKRVQLYQSVYRQLAKDVPWWPYLRYDVGFLVAPDVHDVVLYHESILRSDLVWKG